MTEADSLFGQEHVRRYRETNGEVGHLWQGATVLLLTTEGRNSGEPRTTPLAYDRVGDDFLVLASNGSASEHPGWYRKLAKETQVEVQVKGEVFRAQARTATGPERQRLWALGLDNTPTGTGSRRGRNERSRLSCSSAHAPPDKTRRSKEAHG